MARAATRYVCQACGAVSSRWQGQCGDCAAWNTIQAEAAPAATPFAAKHSLNSGGRTFAMASLADEVELPQRLSTGIGELDRALGGTIGGPAGSGGGLVPGSVILIGGDPGIGKSTLLLQAAGRMACEVIIQSVWVRMVVSAITQHDPADPAKACLPNPLQN